MSRGSIIDRAMGTATVRVREQFYRRGRLFAPYGQFMGLVTVSLAEALRLAERGLVALPGGCTLRELREAACASA